MNVITKTLSDTAARLFFRDAEVTGVTDLGEHFRSIDLAGEALRGVSWKLGDKLQVRAEPDGFAARTYTPIGWDPEAGTTRLLAHVHGDGPGARWVRGLAVGDACQVFGPRGSVAVDPSVPTVFVGDETSFALLAAWHQTNPDALPVAAVFEVSDPDESAAVFEAEQLAATLFVPRLPDDGHVVALGAAVVEALRAAPDAGLLLTGKAQTIAELRRDLKAADLHGRRTKAKAYWDERRSGLD